MMPFKPVSDLLNKHLSQPAWLFGKGPSLDIFDPHKADPLRICINESLSHVGMPTYFFAHDEKPIERVSTNFPKTCLAILQGERANFAATCGIPPEQILVYEKRQMGTADFNLTADDSLRNSQLIGRSGTVHSAIHFCRLIGASPINLVGFDGRGKYASSLKMEVPVGGGSHQQIRNDSIHLLKSLGMDYQFHDDSKLTSRNEKNNKNFDYCSLYDEIRTHGYHVEDDKTTHLAPFIPWIKNNLDVSNVLDIGCSTGRSLDLFNESGFEATGVEVSKIAVSNGRSLGRNVVHGCASRLPFPDDSFDLVCSADVFEHFHIDDAQQACKEACRVSRRYVFMRIAEKEDVTEKWKSIAGHPLHLTTKPIAWWRNWFRPYGKFLWADGPTFCLKIDGCHE